MVITDVNKVIYNGDGVVTAWPFTFRIINNTDIRLMLIDSDGSSTDITSDYYVDMVNSTVYYPGYAPGSEPPEADQPPKVQTGQKIVVYRKLPINQLADLGDKWPFALIELGLDKLTMILQDVYDWLGRCLAVSLDDSINAGDDFDPTVPLAADKVVCGNDSGTGFVAREAMMEVNGAWDGEGRQIHSVADPTANQDAATKKYVDGYADGNFMKLQDDGTAWEGRNLPIHNVGGPVGVKDAATKDYVDSILNGFVLAGDSRTVPFDTLPQLRAADIDAGQIAFTLGYYDVNDGGAGVYNIRTAIPSDVDDGGSIIILDNGNVAELIINGSVNVHQFGAKGNANYQDLSTGNFYEQMLLSSATVAPYYDNVDNSGIEKWYGDATFTDEGLYLSISDGAHYYSGTATEAPYYDNIDNKWYVSAVFTTEGTYLNPDDGKHYVNYDPDTQTYSDEAPYYDNVGEKWYVTAVYSDEGTYTYDDKYWYITTVTEAPYYDNVADKWYVTAAYSNPANCKQEDLYYYNATFLTPAQDDTVAIQNAINTHVPIELLPKRSYIVTSFTIYHGFILHGEGGKLQRPNLKLAPYSYDDNTIKWLRMFDCRSTEIGFNYEKKRTEIHDVYIDCNSWYIWNISSPYQYEQGVNFYLDGVSEYHSKFLFDNVNFSNHYASNITVSNYCDVVISNSSSWDCFKGIATVVGGSGTLEASNVNVNSRFSWVCFWYEPNASTTNKDEYVNISNCYFGGILQGLTNANSSTIITDTTFYITRNNDDMTVSPRDGSVFVLEGCAVVCPEYSNFDIKLRGNGNIIIDSCDVKGTGLYCKYSTANDYSTNIKVSGCNFRKSRFGIVCDNTGQFSVTVSNCKFKDVSDRVFGAHPSKNSAAFKSFIITNCIMDVEGYITKNSGSSDKVPTFGGGNDVVNANNQGIYIYGKNKINMKNEYWSVPVAISKYRSGNTWVAVGFGERWTYVTATPTFVGINDVDFAQLTVSPYTKYKYTGNAWSTLS